MYVWRKLRGGMEPIENLYWTSVLSSQLGLLSSKQSKRDLMILLSMQLFTTIIRNKLDYGNFV